jgi:hypothetical protein
MTIKQPTLSSDNVRVILDDLEKCPPDLILEFGAGGSTLFFLERLKKYCRYKAFENTKQWFFKLAESLEAEYGAGQSQRVYWTSCDYKDFLAGGSKPYTPIVNGKSRYKNWQEAVQLYWFWLVAPDCHATRFPKVPRALWTILRPLLIQIISLLRTMGLARLYNATWVGRCGTADVELLLFPPAIKDQFGESPFRDRYLNPALSSLSELAEQGGGQAFIFIDGGPRHYLLDKIYSHAKTLAGIDVHFYLFDAQRSEYEPVLNKYPASRFCRGNRELWDGSRFYKTQSEQHLEKEMWVSLLSDNR